jgi:hypothetical protein
MLGDPLKHTFVLLTSSKGMRCCSRCGLVQRQVYYAGQTRWLPRTACYEPAKR